MKTKILVVDDEDTLCEVLRFNLEEAGYEVDVAHSAEEALTMPLSGYSLILLDIMMGDISGTQLASILRNGEATKHVAIIFCTAKDAEDDMVKGLRLGADDYITKPYSIRNVLARVEAVLRRVDKHRQSEADADTVRYKDLVLLPQSKICRVDGVETRLPKKEFEILLTLMTHPGKVFSRDELLKRIWTDDVVVVDRVVDVNITRIRQKLGHYAHNIVTRSGYGYAFIE